jgi:serine/threonine protein phosphatase 1
MGSELTYAIGDIHGCLNQVQRLIKICERDPGNQKIKFILLGDYIDRGPDSRGVIDYLIDLQKWSPDETICLRGNHEDLLLSAIEDEAIEPNWLLNGGISTLDSYRVSSPFDLPPAHIEWLRSLPFFHDDGMRFFAHASVHPARSLDQQNTRDLLWIIVSLKQQRLRPPHCTRSPTAFERHPDQRHNRLNIDTGAVLDGRSPRQFSPLNHCGRRLPTVRGRRISTRCLQATLRPPTDACPSNQTRPQQFAPAVLS